MNDQQTQDAREDTMLYRKPTPDSDDNAVQDIWGEKLEVRTVDASEVPDLLAEGWVTHPLELGGGEKKQKPEQAAGFEPIKGEALEAAEKLAEELTTERDKLLGEIKDLTVERDMLKDETARSHNRLKEAVTAVVGDHQATLMGDPIDAATGALKSLHSDVTALQERSLKLADDLKAAEVLTAEETKAKEAALAELAELKAVKPTLSAKPKGN